VYCWETGRAAPKDETKVLIAKALRVKPGTIFAYPTNGDEAAA